jgi:hypothetical protein
VAYRFKEEIIVTTKKIFALSFLCLMAFGSRVFGEGFLSFTAESKRAEEELSCRYSKTTPPSYEMEMGVLYSCILGSAETVKWYINEIPNTHRVENIKLMWNDWFKDIGYGLHSDRDEAQQALKVLVTFYAPEKGNEVEEAFWGDLNKTIESDDFILKYTYFRGSAIDERLISVIPKQ